MIFVRRELGTRLRLKRIPNLHVRLDDSVERGTRVLKLIDALESGADPSPVGEGESLPTPSRRPGPVEGISGTPSADGFGAAAAEYAAELAERRKAARSRRRDAREDRPRRRPGRQNG